MPSFGLACIIVEHVIFNVKCSILTFTSLRLCLPYCVWPIPLSHFDYWNLFQCPTNSHCINNRGSYTCECDHGFHVPTAALGTSLGTPISGTSPTGSTIICEDIDECEVNLYGPIDCDVNADCLNTRGSYKCQCKTGYEANSYDGTEATDPKLNFQNL